MYASHVALLGEPSLNIWKLIIEVKRQEAVSGMTALNGRQLSANKNLSCFPGFLCVGDTRIRPPIVLSLHFKELTEGEEQEKYMGFASPKVSVV